MPDWIGKLAEIFFNKIAPLPLFVVAGSSAILLFASDRFLSKLSLLVFRDSHIHWIGPAFLISTLYLIGYAINWAAGLVGQGFNEKRIKRAIHKRLETLNGEERNILSDFLLQDARTMELRSDHPAVLSLEAAGFIFKASGQRVMGRYSREADNVLFDFKYHVNEYIYEHLKKHPELVAS